MEEFGSGCSIIIVRAKKVHGTHSFEWGRYIKLWHLIQRAEEGKNPDWHS
jgi:hypothetical protein